jgi:hypothetical protein
MDERSGLPNELGNVGRNGMGKLFTAEGGQLPGKFSRTGSESGGTRMVSIIFPGVCSLSYP